MPMVRGGPEQALGEVGHPYKIKKPISYFAIALSGKGGRFGGEIHSF